MAFFAGDANLYRYVGNSPTNGTDPSGLKVWDPNYLGQAIYNGLVGAVTADLAMPIYFNNFVQSQNWVPNSVKEFLWQATVFGKDYTMKSLQDFGNFAQSIHDLPSMLVNKFRTETADQLLNDFGNTLFEPYQGGRGALGNRDLAVWSIAAPTNTTEYVKWNSQLFNALVFGAFRPERALVREGPGGGHSGRYHSPALRTLGRGRWWHGAGNCSKEHQPPHL